MTRPPKDRDREALIALLAAGAEETARSGATDEPLPEPEKLLDFLAGHLDPEEEERLSRHLLANPEASRALLDLADLEAAGDEAGERPAELAAVAGWRDFERRLPGAQPARFRRFQTLLPSIAAALLVATLGLSAWLWQIQGKLNRPVANPRSLELVVTRAGTEPVLAAAPGDPLLLTLRPSVRCPDYRARIEEPAGGTLWTVERLKLDPLGNLNLLLPRAGPGAYSLRLSGCEPRRELEEYRFRITADGG